MTTKPADASDTPLTNRADEFADKTVYDAYYQMRDHARTLEHELAALRAERDAMRALLLDMRQHQGAIQPYIKLIDAALAAPEMVPT